MAIIHNIGPSGHNTMDTDLCGYFRKINESSDELTNKGLYQIGVRSLEFGFDSEASYENRMIIYLRVKRPSGAYNYLQFAQRGNEFPFDLLTHTLELNEDPFDKDINVGGIGDSEIADPPFDAEPIFIFSAWHRLQRGVNDDTNNPWIQDVFQTDSDDLPGLMIPRATGNLENPREGLFKAEDWTDHDFNDVTVAVRLLPE